MDRIRALREHRGWSQAELAERAGVTRQLVGAVEANRHVPNVRAAIGLAAALGVSVEELFGDAPAPELVEAIPGGVVGASLVATARVGERLVVAPLRHGIASWEAWGLADAMVHDGAVVELPDGSRDGLVIAGCDPMLGLLEALLHRVTGDRLVAVHASTGRSVEALADGRVHGIMVHGPVGRLPVPPVAVARWHVARWRVGLAAVARSGVPSIEELVGRRVRVVQRDPGAASQRAFERALVAAGATGSDVSGPVGDGHVDVARRVAAGAGRVGVTMEAAARAFGLRFAALEEHEVELWIDERWRGLPAVDRLVELLDHPALTQRLAALGGYDLVNAGVAIDPLVRGRPRTLDEATPADSDERP